VISAESRPAAAHPSTPRGARPRDPLEVGVGTLCRSLEAAAAQVESAAAADCKCARRDRPRALIATVVPPRRRPSEGPHPAFPEPRIPLQTRQSCLDLSQIRSNMRSCKTPAGQEITMAGCRNLEHQNEGLVTNSIPPLSAFFLT
jgi:hypothetical protein